MQGRGRGIRGFMEQLCGEGGDVYEGWTASERKGSWSVCRRLETGSRQWIGQRTLFKLVGQGGLANQAESGQDYSSSNIRQGNAGLNSIPLIPACTARPGLPLSPPEIAFLESPYYRPQTASTSIADRHHPKTFIQSPTHKTMTLQAGYDNDHK